MSYSAFAKIHENGFNKILDQFHIQRPSSFNYGTSFFHSSPKNFCEFDQDITAVPYSTELNEISFPGIEDKLHYAFQVRDVKFDFFPKTHADNEIPIPNQSLQFYFRICLGIKFDNSELFCSCFTIITNGKFVRVFENGKEYLTPTVDIITIPEIEPESLRNIFEKLITQMVNNKIFKEMKTSVESISFQLGKDYDFELVLSQELPNPSISQDVFSVSMIIKQ